MDRKAYFVNHKLSYDKFLFNLILITLNYNKIDTLKCKS